jgi:hypothetical protein
MASFTGGMGVSFQDRNPKDGPLPYRPHLQYSGLPGQARPPRLSEQARDGGQAQGISIIDATLRFGAAAIMMLDLGAVPQPPGKWLPA